MIKIIYFIVLGFLIICIIFSILQIKFTDDCHCLYQTTGTITLIYLFAKIIAGIILLIAIQKSYNGDWNNWDNNICPNIKSLTLFWLILNYITIGFLTIHMIFSFIRTLLSSDKTEFLL